MNKKRAEIQLYRPPCSRNHQSVSSKNQNGESDSTKQEKSEKTGTLTVKEKLKLNIAYIYTNDLIMRNIITNITNLKDRNRLELSSKRLFNLSQKSGWTFLNQQRKLVLGFETLSNFITVRISTFATHCPCLTIETRRHHESFNGKKTIKQPYGLLFILSKITDRFGKYVQDVVIGGRSEIGREIGIENHIFVITSDLMKMFNRFTSLRSIQFRSCLFDSEAVDFLSSPECIFQNGATSIRLNGIYLDRDIDTDRIPMFITDSTKCLYISDMNITTFGKYISRRIENLKNRLKRVSIVITAINDIFTACEVITKLSSMCAEMELSFVNTEGIYNKNILAVLRNIKYWKNIRALTLNINVVKQRDCDDLSEILEDVALLESLQYLNVGEWKDSNMLNFLTRGIKNCRKLETLTLTNPSYNTHMSDFLEFIAVLPLTISELNLSGVPLSVEVLELLITKYRRGLLRFTICNPRNCCSIQIFTMIMKFFSSLEEFSLDQPIPWFLVAYILENEKIKKANVVIQSCPSFLTKILSDHFEIIEIKSTSIRPYAKFLKMKKRKYTGASNISIGDLKKMDIDKSHISSPISHFKTEW